MISLAYKFATKCHTGQVRMYTYEPYITHPIAVAKMVSTVTQDPDMICAALLHDVVEDCDVTNDEICHKFGYRVAQLVLEITQFSVPSDGNRKVRKLLLLGVSDLAIGFYIICLY